MGLNKQYRTTMELPFDGEKEHTIAVALSSSSSLPITYENIYILKTKELVGGLKCLI